MKLFFSSKKQKNHTNFTSICSYKFILHITFFFSYYKLLEYIACESSKYSFIDINNVFLIRPLGLTQVVKGWDEQTKEQ